MDAYLDQVRLALETGADFDTGWTVVDDRQLRIAKTGFVIQCGEREPGAVETSFRHRPLPSAGQTEEIVSSLCQLLAELDGERISALARRPNKAVR